MKFFLKKYMYLLPIILLGVDILSLFVDLNYVVAGNIAGYSIVTNIVFIYIFSYSSYCWLTKLAPIGMTVINLVNIVGNYIDDKFYNFWYVITIFCVLLTLTLILEIDKRLKA
jgi:hypothetical protein